MQRKEGYKEGEEKRKRDGSSLCSLSQCFTLAAQFDEGKGREGGAEASGANNNSVQR